MSRRSFGARRYGKRGRDSDKSDAASGRAFDDTDEASNSSGPLRQREAYMRMNFLFQAAHLTATGPAACLPLSRFYAATMRKIGTRLTIRSSPSVKSDTCKVCHSLLLPTPTPTLTPTDTPTTTVAAVVGGGVTAALSGARVLQLDRMGSSVSLQQSSHSAQPALIRTCHCCGAERRVGLKRHKKRGEEVALAEGAALHHGEPVQLPHVQQPTTATGTASLTQPDTAAPMLTTDVDAVR